MFPFELMFIWALTAFTVYIGIFWMYIAIKEQDNLKRYPKPTRFPSISVLIPAYNEEKTIAKCIDSIKRLVYPSKIEIIVINDGSTDRTKEIAQQYEKKGVIKLLSQKNKGKGAALNSGLAIAKGEMVAIMDADSVVEKNALEKLVGHFDDEKVGAVVSSIKAMNTNNLIQRMQSVEYIISCVYRRLGSLTDMIYITPGVFSLFRKDALKKIGGVDEKNLTEDLEIALRLRLHGYVIRNSMSAITKTTLPSTIGAFYKQRMRWYRGLVKNTFRYKKMLFNREYGYLGIMQLPMNIIFPFISLAIVGLLLYTNYIGLTHLITDLSIMSFKFNLNLSLEKLILNFDWRVMFPWIVSFSFGLFVIIFTYSKMQESIGKTIGRITSILFLMIYFTIINLLWAIALIKELRRSEEKW